MTRAAIEARINATPIKGSPDQMRRAFERLAGQRPRPQGIEHRVNGIECVVHGQGDPLVWLHGGGYVFGSPDSHAAAAATLAALTDRAVWLPRYRLAPEHPWPAMRNDVLALLAGMDQPVPLIGDSAGGHLALNCALSAPQDVAALVLFSPNTDRSGRSETRKANSEADLMNDDAQDRSLWRMAMPEHSEADTEASPLLADLTDLPPVWITASTNEVLLDDTLLLIRALAQCGVPVTSQIIAPLFHMWILWPDHLDAARRSIASAAGFINALPDRSDGPAA